jgi:hypothetical protein
VKITQCLPLQVGPIKGAGTHECDAARSRKMTECALEIDSAYGNTHFLGMYDNLVCTNLLMGLELKWFKGVKVYCWTAKAKGMQRESGARVPQTSRRQYRGVVCVSPSTPQTTDTNRGLVGIKKRGRLGRCDRATTSSLSGAHSDVHGSDRVAQANAHGQHFPCPPRNDFANLAPLLRKDHS